MKQAHILVSGFVQGVGYRRFVRKNAIKQGVNGWVVNLSDRRVEAVFQGKEEGIKELIKICQKGPYFSEVKDICVEWQEAKEIYNEFRLVF